MRTVVVIVASSDADLAADRLWMAGARAIEERRAGVDGDAVALVTVLSETDEVSLERLGELPPSWKVEFVDADDRPAETWRDHVVPIEVNERLIIRPAWLPSIERDGCLDVAIDPAGSFGLGDHPTTRLSAATVDRLVKPGDRVLDVGCGSGVLGIVAARRGAVEVLAIDIAESAREATVANAERNGVADTVRARTTPITAVDGAFDLVLANILAPTLVAMADDLRRVTAANGALVVSGMLADRHEHVIEALHPLHVVARDLLDGWAVVVLRWPSDGDRADANGASAFEQR